MGFTVHMLGVSPMQPSVGSAVPALSVAQISFLRSPVSPSALAAMLRGKLEDKGETLPVFPHQRHRESNGEAGGESYRLSTNALVCKSLW